MPGAYDIPIIADALLQRSDVDAVITLGAIIHGKTKHDEVIANSTRVHKPTLGISVMQDKA